MNLCAYQAFQPTGPSSPLERYDFFEAASNRSSPCVFSSSFLADVGGTVEMGFAPGPRHPPCRLLQVTPLHLQRSSRIAHRHRFHRRCGSQVGRPYWIQRQPHELASMATWTEPSGVHHGAALQSPGPDQKISCIPGFRPRRLRLTTPLLAADSNDENLVRYYPVLAPSPLSTP